MTHRLPERLVPLLATLAAVILGPGDLRAQEEVEVAPTPLAPAFEKLAPEASPGGKAELRRSMSSSKQFVVYGDDLPLRSEFCVYTESVKTDLNSLLNSGAKDWDSPVVLRVSRGIGGGELPRGKSISTAIRPYDFGGWLLQLDVFLGADFSREELEEELVRVLLAERILSEGNLRVIATRQSRILPDWLHRGIVGVLRYRREGRPSETFQAVWKAGVPMHLDEVLEGDYRQMDALGRRMFEASATGLVYALHRQRDGRHSLREMLGNLARVDLEQRELLARHFPLFQEGRDAIDKWWTLEMATLAEGSPFETFDAPRTDARLAQNLRISFGVPGEEEKAEKKGLRLFGSFGRPHSQPPKAEARNPSKPREQREIELRQLAELDDHPDREAILLRETEELMALSLRSFPLFLPVIADYVTLLSEASRGKRIRDLDSRLEKLEAHRLNILAMVRRTEHYLDFYEATETRHLSSDFEEYLRLMEAFERPAPPRPDPISRYLDQVESEWE